MLKGSENNMLYVNWTNYIQEPSVKEAFAYLVGVAACLKDLSCNIQWKGDVRDFRYIDAFGEQPFSFITNQKWLLFYIRSPAVRLLNSRRLELESLFKSFNENSAGEWTVKLIDIPDIKRLGDFLGWELS